METKPENPLAFPQRPTVYRNEYGNNEYLHSGYDGMTLRDYFAAHAPITMQDAVDYHHARNEPVTYERTIKTLAQMRAAYANEMLAARMS